jgi:hypothetical protein
MKKTDQEILKAFQSDNYEVKKSHSCQGQRGFLAEHEDPIAKVRKKVLYVEGDGYQMGYLIGKLAGEDVRRMTTEYVDNIIPAFINPKLEQGGRSFLMQLLMKVFTVWCDHIYMEHPADIPEPLRDEMRGIEDGCKDSGIPVTYSQILSLNAGIDCLLSGLYTGEAGIEKWINHLLPHVPKEPIKSDDFSLPLACNAFAAFGDATIDRKFYFGRDFMFPTAGVFQDTACLIIYNPTYQFEGKPALPLVSQTAPGFVGSIVAMNTNGVAIGVDVVPSGNCDPSRPGLNSLLLVRYAGHSGDSAETVVKVMEEAQRGVSWIYPVGDGTTNRAVVVEAGMKTNNLNPLEYPPAEMKHLLPKGGFESSRHGLFARWNDWKYPASYLDFNPKLFRKWLKHPWSPEQFGEKGYINENWKHGLDRMQYFAPQRESKDNLVLATNFFIVPEMRLCAMGNWPNSLSREKIRRAIWRYDELNWQCLEAYGSIDKVKAIELIDFLSPLRGKFPDYYWQKGTPALDGRIEGSVSLCNLTDKTISSHFGYYYDSCVNLSLMNYV